MVALRDYQEEAVQRIVDGHLLLCDEPGLGKTIQAIMGAVRFEPNGIYLVVCPKHLRHQWKYEIESALPGYEVRFLTIRDFNLGAVNVVPEERRVFYITHYEVMTGAIATLRSTLFDVIIADEAHRLKNRKAERTKAFGRLKGRRKVALTATELEKATVEIFPIIRWFYTDERGKVENDFMYFFRWASKRIKEKKILIGNKVFYEWGEVIEGSPFYGELRPFYLRRTKAEVLPSLPPIIESVVHVPMESMQKKVYDAILKSDDIEVGVEGEYDKAILGVLGKITELQKASSFTPNGQSSKVEWIEGWLKDHPKTNVLILTRFRKTAELIKERVPSATLVMGGTNNIEEVYNKDNYVVVAVINSIGEGVSLPHVEFTIFAETMYSSIQMTQARNRFHRMTNGEQKSVIVLISSPIDEVIYKSSGDKEKVIEDFRKNILRGEGKGKKK